MKRNMHLIPPDDEFDRYRAASDVFEQTVDARDRLYRKPEAYLQLPWPNVDDLVGGIAPGDVWFVAGFSGNGKTTWLMNCVNNLLLAGKTVYYLGLETRPAVLRTHLACLRLGLYAGDVLSGFAARTWVGWQETRKLLVAALEEQRLLGEGDRFLVNGVTHVGEPELRAAAHDAAMDKADVIVIDHVDHIRYGASRSRVEETERVVHLILDLAQEKGLRMLVATQCNNEAVKGDRLGQYQPPQPHHVYMGGTKRQVATGMLGLFRPVLPNAPKDLLHEVRMGQREVSDVLIPNTMGVVVMKSRYYGNREGKRTTLHLVNGKLVTPSEAGL